MTPLLLIGATVVAFALGVYFGRRSLGWTDLYDVCGDEAEETP
jgi:polyferredoxin